MLPEPAFVDPGTAPEFFADGLHHVELKGQNCRFVLYVSKRSHEGIEIREPPFTCIVPTESIGPAIALVLRTLPSGLLMPAIEHMAGSVRTLLRLN